MTARYVDHPQTVENHLGGVDASFEQRLIEALQPIRGHFLAAATHAFFDCGAFDRLAADAPVAMPDVTDELGLEPSRLDVLLRYLANEGVVEVVGDQVGLTPRGRALGEFRSWYTFLIGGYAETLTQLPAALARGSDPCTRNGADVALGSCEIARFDGIPLTRAVLRAGGATVTEVLDLGCGNGLYLAELCRELPDVRAWGAEPDPGGYAEAVTLLTERGLDGRVSVVNRGAIEFLDDPPAGCAPDVLVFGFVLQEILEQAGEDAVVDLLARAVRSFPAIDIVVIEVSNDIDDPSRMRHGLAQSFWNPYFLIHPFTRQRLEQREFWELLFEKAGLDVAAFATTDPRVDSTGIELGYLLRGPEHPSARRDG